MAPDPPRVSSAPSVRAVERCTNRRRSGVSDDGLQRNNSTAQFGGSSEWRSARGSSDRHAGVAAITTRAVLKSAGEDSSYGSGGKSGDNRSGVFTLDLSVGADKKGSSSSSENSLSDGFGSSSGDNKNGGSGSGSGSHSADHKSTSSSNFHGSGGSASGNPFGKIIRPSDYIDKSKKKKDGSKIDMVRNGGASASPRKSKKPAPIFMRLFRGAQDESSMRKKMERTPSMIGRNNFSAALDAEDAVDRRLSAMSAARRNSATGAVKGSSAALDAESLASSLSISMAMDDDDSNAKKGRWRRMSITKRVCVAAVAVAGVACVTIGVALPDSQPVVAAREAIKTLVRGEEQFVLGQRETDLGEVGEEDAAKENNNRELDDLVTATSNSTNAAAPVSVGYNREMGEAQQQHQVLRGGLRPHLTAQVEEEQSPPREERFLLNKWTGGSVAPVFADDSYVYGDASPP
uniref:Uncharacterized protein n=1 Tax=Odontella aurita TaxID=265563 RepID=A0A7S4M4D4_9STRA|mmetsp:Transcript_10405/g.30607  ORF Transcript_10405/g.30607 Transcript_10405/m.30607 type:complete len:461 (+) Transcript_10405:205-1587(+)|eukprot:CAMPEP_0113569060 /NCGR_PEP_ID=MMETSP0015_2-20120614/24194_1 /TAXON_ID=2838 /ORGANISM="Odontella" /LENGTH=460 /DNA_ID=CAMNT_0000471669 /DNA_START=105 /DNA_END=1487 /DNA_ORIENTATION=+ /assembly_acc=CAM_ASM_000160